ncbi:xenopus 14s cohesin smc1 subunit, related [Neospora caninum Liverpool]|uniref:Xenopus 14s cohesin smc1 subunit, related n=1 Tax=Neospora caninum (strain Liverpool) TaxID=572307 RepID=F0VBQ7_NEOCL|nr:xenopus 14s cohesin smc1 subunit, related [Neospora caninum Liverpool]CBZ51041.1 xenopus 14s cohesin smc1 subunit, related [Neospora caninum Liverpool]CEL68347.1 TPA: Xenopus 14s cohesin smc1 subunit, related [Neospora caninum Liverpool]|eukprot:XP_003881074.1 xenopus 14s cohesin smc1 subunit, related [Neospora caninum Liverpool]
MKRTRAIGSTAAQVPRPEYGENAHQKNLANGSLAGASGNGSSEFQNDGDFLSSVGEAASEPSGPEVTMSDGEEKGTDWKRDDAQNPDHSCPGPGTRRSVSTDGGALFEPSPGTPQQLEQREPEHVSETSGNGGTSDAIVPVEDVVRKGDPQLSLLPVNGRSHPTETSASRRRKDAGENPAPSLMELMEQALESRRSGMPFIGGGIWSKDSIAPPDPFAATLDVGAVFRKGAKIGRLRLRWVVLENFKSYKGTHVIGPLYGSVAVIGPNGAGKSNLTDAICFALGVNAKQLRCSRLVELIHASDSKAQRRSGLDAREEMEGEFHAEDGSRVEEKASAAVTLHFVRGPVPASSPLPERISFTRRINRSGDCSYLLDGVSVPLEDYRGALRRHCGCTVHTLQAMLIFQGHIDALATKSPQGLASLVEEISGSAELAEAYQEAQEAVRDAREEARRLLFRRTQLEQDMKVLKKQKHEADAYEREQQLQKEQQDELFLFRLLATETLRAEEEAAERRAHQKEEEEKEKLDGLLAEAQQADRGRVGALLRVQKAKAALATFSRRGNQLRGAYLAMMERLKFLEKEREAAARQKAIDESQREDLEAFEEALKNQLIHAAQKRRETEAQLEAEKEKESQALLPENRKLLETLEEEWEELHALQQQRIRNHQEQLKALRNSLDLLQREEREMQRTVETVRDLHGEAATKAAEVAESLQRLLAQAQDAKENLDDLRNLATTSQAQRESLLRLQEELHDRLSQERSLQMDVRRVHHEREVCRQLQKHVSHACVHGSALDCCRPANKRLTLAVAAAMGAKASSVIVDSQAVAVKCIEYLKTARLGTCEFLPVETLRQKQLKGRPEDAFDDEEGALLPPPSTDSLPPGCRWAVDCVSFEDRFRPVYEFLLSDCVVVPSLAVAQELKFGRGSAGAALHRYRFVTLDGEKLQRGGVISFDLGGLTGRLAARWEAQQQDRLVERVEKVKEQLRTLENAETTTVERLQQRTAHFNLLHRQCVQLQAKARVWEEQAEEKQKKLTRVQAQLQALREREAARKQEITAKQQDLDEIHASLLQQQQRHFARLDEAVGRAHVHLEQRRRRQRVEALKTELASLHAQESQLLAEQADCSDRLGQLQRAAQTAEAARGTDGEADEKRLLTQLALTERDVEEAEKRREEAAAAAREAQQDLQTQEKNVQKIRERVEASQQERKRLSREAEAALGRQRQQTVETMQILKQADQQGLRLPLARGSWRSVRAWIYGEDDAERTASGEGDECRSEDAANPEDDCGQGGTAPTTTTGRRHEMRSDDSSDGEDKAEEGDREGRWSGSDGLADEKLFAIDFSKLAAEKREFISQHKHTPARLLEAVATQEAELRRRAARLRALCPNLKVGEKEKKTHEQLETVEEQIEKVQREGRAASSRLAQLQRERSDRFLACFHHCKIAVDFFFRELTAVGVGDDETPDAGARRAFERLGGRAYLDLEGSAGGSAEDEVFFRGVALLCMPPGKRLLPLHLLSGGERLVAALALVLALLSFTPHVPFLLFDEVDAPLDAHRRQALARLLKLLPRHAGLQVLFISLKDKMFSSADLLVGVAKAPPLGVSRCFFLDLLPYRLRPSLSRSRATSNAQDDRAASTESRDHGDELERLHAFAKETKGARALDGWHEA